MTGPARLLVPLVVAAVAVLAIGVVLQAAGDDPAVAPLEPEVAEEAGVVVYQPVVLDTHPHAITSYTQGLEFVDGLLLESTGLRGESSILLADPETGEAVDSMDLAASLFGEGATVVGDEVYQLTWTSEVAIVRSLDDLSEVRRFEYEGPGWGLCLLDERLVMSNGSAELAFRDPETFEVLDTVQVSGPNGPIEEINELECVDGRVWANVFQTNRILELDPTTGALVGEVDLTELVPDGFEGDQALVLNGIAFNAATGRFWVTGKQWPVIYEVEFEPVS